MKNRSRTNIIVYFRCPHCDMLYRLISYFKDRSLSKRPRIMEYGTIFLDRLKELVKENVSIYKIRELLGIHEITIIKLVDDLNLKYIFWENKIKNNKKLQESVKLINDLLESDIKISKHRIFSLYKKHLDYIRFYDRKSYREIIAKF